MRRAVFLDRDGVILKLVFRDGKLSVPYSVAEAEVLPGVPEALSMLKNAGFWLFVVTNQPEVARGALRRESVEEIHAWLQDRLPQIDRIRACCHDALDGCDCRKPRPGLINALRQDFRIDGGFMVGDRWKDMDAGHFAGLKTVFVDSGVEEKKPDRFDSKAKSLLEAACWIVSQGEVRE